MFVSGLSSSLFAGVCKEVVSRSSALMLIVKRRCGGGRLLRPTAAPGLPVLGSRTRRGLPAAKPGEGSLGGYSG